MSSPLNNPQAALLAAFTSFGSQGLVLSRPPSVAGSLSDAGSEREVVFVPVPIMITPEMLERRLPSPMPHSSMPTLPMPTLPAPRSPRLSIGDGQSPGVSARQSPSLAALGVQGAANRVLTAIDLTAASIDTVGTAVETVVDHTQNTIEALRNRSWYQRISAWFHSLPCCRSDSAVPDIELQQRAAQ